jgi:hypothetical protein
MAISPNILTKIIKYAPICIIPTGLIIIHNIIAIIIMINIAIISGLYFKSLLNMIYVLITKIVLFA